MMLLLISCCVEAAVGGQMNVRLGKESIPTRIYSITALFRPLALQLLAQVDDQLTLEKNS